MSNINSSILNELKRRFPELGEAEPLNGGDAVDRLNAWLSELGRDADCREDDPSGGLGEQARLDCLVTARDVYGTEDIEIDDNADLSVGHGIVWVAAWVCLLGDDLPEPLRRTA